MNRNCCNAMPSEREIENDQICQCPNTGTDPFAEITSTYALQSIDDWLMINYEDYYNPNWQSECH